MLKSQSDLICQQKDRINQLEDHSKEKEEELKKAKERIASLETIIEDKVTKYATYAFIATKIFKIKKKITLYASTFIRCRYLKIRGQLSRSSIS
jgi:hypothetical protein